MIRQLLGRRSIGIVLLISLMACSTPKQPIGIPELQELENYEAVQISDAEDAVPSIRRTALRETGMSVGARGGLTWRGAKINRTLEGESKQLDTVFNFQVLLLDDNVLPPVLIESRESLNLATPYSIRVADRSYRILKQARFVTLVPTWRDYLIMDETIPEMPDKSLLPKTRKEREVWRIAVQQGWYQGIAQADMIYTENFARLKRDYQGMIRYRMLLAQNMVSAPQVAHRQMGVTGGGEELSVNDRTLTIQALPALRAESESWSPAVHNEKDEGLHAIEGPEAHRLESPDK